MKIGSGTDGTGLQVCLNGIERKKERKKGGSRKWKRRSRNK
jgi:hypothetical protein